MLCNVGIPKLKKNQSMAKLKQFKAQVVEMWFISNLECRYAVLSRGMQHWLIDTVKSAHRSPQVRIMRENTCKLTLCYLDDQVLTWWTKWST